MKGSVNSELLFVTNNRFWVKPFFSIRIFEIFLGEIAVFECQLTTDKLPVNWFIGDQNINSRTFSVLKYETRLQDLRAQLLVKNVTERDFHKKFTITVGNEARF